MEIGAVRGLGYRDFLYLLVTQLRYQNPIQPIDTHQFLTQLAHFSTLSEIISLNKTFQSFAQETSHTRALSLLNTVVTAKHPLTGNLIQGTITAVNYINGVPYFTLRSPEGDVMIEWADVVAVSLP